MTPAPSVYRVERLELDFAPRRWPFADERRSEIDLFFSALQREKPALWNGRVLLLHRQALTDGAFRGAFLETDYASFAAWSQWGRPPADVFDCFSAAAILAADGAFVLGVMGAHTFNAGRVYFPCGTPDLRDVAGQSVDLAFSVRRELNEETGFAAGDFSEETGWTAVIDGPLIALIKVFRSSHLAHELRQEILQRLARERQPELADIRIVRGSADFESAMPPFVTAFLAYYWRTT